MNQMRRKDREMDKSFAYSVIDKAEFGTLATINEDGNPYCIPVSIARRDDKIYFHSAKLGTKIENIMRNPNVCMSFVGDVHVPEELNENKISNECEENIRKALDTRFTTEFESAVIFGKISIVDDREEKILGLRLITEKYCPKDMPFFDAAIDISYNITYVLRIDIETVTGKRKKFDKNGVEMKWGRMEQ